MILHHYEGIANVCLYFLNRFKNDCCLGEQYASQRFPTIAIDILLQIFIRTEAKCIFPFIDTIYSSQIVPGILIHTRWNN